jgi:hypothetical protein
MALTKINDRSGYSVDLTGYATEAYVGSQGFLDSLPAGSIKQVVSQLSTASATQSISVRTWTQVSFLSATITPSSTSSKILFIGRCMHEFYGGQNEQFNGIWGVYRDSARINYGTASITGNAGDWSRGIQTTVTSYQPDNFTTLDMASIQTVDSPNTTSAVTYRFGYSNSNDGGTLYFNRSRGLDNQNSDLGSSEIILMEIAG